MATKQKAEAESAPAEAQAQQEVPNFPIPLRNCSNCTYYHHVDGPRRTVAHAEHKTGECRKYAPRPILGAGRVNRVPHWPTVTNLIFCHEFVQADD